MRRLAAVAGLLVMIVLALALFWRIYRHHHLAEPYEHDRPAVVRLDASEKFDVRITAELG